MLGRVISGIDYSGDASAKARDFRLPRRHQIGRRRGQAGDSLPDFIWSCIFAHVHQSKNVPSHPQERFLRNAESPLSRANLISIVRVKVNFIKQTVPLKFSREHFRFVVPFFSYLTRLRRRKRETTSIERGKNKEKRERGTNE